MCNILVLYTCYWFPIAFDKQSSQNRIKDCNLGLFLSAPRLGKKKKNSYTSREFTIQQSVHKT